VLDHHKHGFGPQVLRLSRDEYQLTEEQIDAVRYESARHE
jgi:hypothetical protein